MFPFLMLLALAAQAQGMLYATHRFAIPAVSPAIFNLASVLSGLALGHCLGPRFGFDAVHGMAAGVVSRRHRATCFSAARGLARRVLPGGRNGISNMRACGTSWADGPGADRATPPDRSTFW